MGRVRRVVQKMNQRITVQLAATLLAGSTLLSSGLGLYRDRILNSQYLNCEGPCYPVGIDAYTAAFTVPDFMFFILVSGALSVTFIPVFNQRLATGNKKSAWQLSASLINFMALITLVTSILIIIFAEPLLRYIIAPGLSESGMALAVSMMRVIAVNPFLFAIATVIASVQQAVGRFAFYALAPTIYNIGIIIGATVFTGGINIFGFQIFEGGIMGVALGVVLGSILQLIVSSIGLIGLGFDYEFKIFWRNKGFRKVLNLLPARSFDQGMDYVVSLMETNLASRMTEGTVRIFQQATTLHVVPINLIGVSISTAAFPRLTERLSENRIDLFKDELRSVIRAIVWLALPVAIITYFTRGYVVSFISHRGNSLMAGLLGVFAVAILFRCLYHILARSFYAQQDTKTPLYISIVAISLNVFLAIWFTFSLRYGAYGLAVAQAIVAIVEVVILFTMMEMRTPGVLNKYFWQGILRMASAAGFMSIICYFMVHWLPFEAGARSLYEAVPKFIFIVLVSLSTYLMFSRLLQIKESEPVMRKLRKVFFRA